MSLFTDLYEAHLTIGGHDITWREIIGNAVRARVRRRRHAAAGLGLAGRHHRQRPALHRLPLHRDRGRPRRQPALRAGRPAGLLHRRVGLRLVALVAATATAGEGAPAVSPRWATGSRARRLPRGLGRRRRGLLRRLPGDRRRLPGGVVVLPGRRVDLRRLDRRDLRDGPRVGGLLAVLDRRRPGRRAAAAALELLPVGRALRHLRRVRRLGLRHLAAGGAHRGRADRCGAAPRPDEVPA